MGLFKGKGNSQKRRGNDAPRPDVMEKDQKGKKPTANTQEGTELKKIRALLKEKAPGSRPGETPRRWLARKEKKTKKALR